MMPRELLPSRRHSWTQRAKIGGHKFYLCVGEYEDGRPGEIFITADRYGTFSRGTLDTLARSVSMSLQNGVALTDVTKMLRGLPFPPDGPVVAEGSGVTSCVSVADWIGQELEAVYCKQPEVPEEIAIPVVVMSEKVAGRGEGSGY